LSGYLSYPGEDQEPSTMIYQKKLSSGPFLKKGIDIKDKDLLEVANEGKQVQGNYGMQNIFLVKTADGKEGNVEFKQSSINNMIDAFGPDAINWVGKKVKAWIFNDIKDGKPIIKLIITHPDAELTSAGFVLPKSVKSEPEAPKTANLEGDDEVRVEDIPF